MQQRDQYSGACGQLNWTAAAVTETGLVRKINEDRYMVNPSHNHFVVADGMGGHKKGDVASKAVCDAMMDMHLPPDLHYIGDAIEDQLLAVSEYLQRLALSEGGDIIGSTVVGLIQVEQAAYYYWAGDSRIYRYRQGTLKQLSRDHTYENDMRNSGKFTAQQIAEHPHKNMITIAVGADNAFAISNEMTTIEHGDLFLLCSDGIDKELTDKQLRDLLGKKSEHPQQAGETIIHQVLAAGARDNATLILTRFERKAHDE